MKLSNNHTWTALICTSISLYFGYCHIGSPTDHDLTDGIPQALTLEPWFPYLALINANMPETDKLGYMVWIQG